MLSVLFLIAGITASVPAQEQSQQEEPQAQAEEEEQEPVAYQETVVVTASGTEQELGNAGTFISAFTEEDLADSPALVIDEQLRRVPGFSLFRRSSSIFSHPTTQGVSLRGIGPSGASRSLVLWNGIPLNDPFGNWVYWNRLPATSNRSAEISRGATSQLYGSSALGGTIQLIPKPAEAKTLDARLQFGNRGTYDADVFASHRGEDWSFIASGRVFDTDGYIPVREEERGDVDIPTKTKFQTFLGRLEYRDFHVGVNVFKEERSNGTPAQQNDSQVLLVETGYDADTWSFNFYGQSQELTSAFSRILPGRNREIPFGATRFPSTGFGSSFTMRLPSGIQWGVDWRNVSWEPDDDVPDNSESQNFAGAFMQYIFTFDERVDLLLGGRFDLYQNTSTKATFNPRAALTFRASPVATVRASVYRGFRAPSLNELYRGFRVGNVVTAPNDQLAEEYLWGFEGGVDLHPSRSVLVRLNGFFNSLRDAVANVTLCTEPSGVHPLCEDLPPGTVQRQRQNLGSATIAGFEASAHYSFASDWTARAGYLFSDAVNDDSDLRLPQVAQHQGNIGIGYRGPVVINADLRFVGDAFEDDLNDFLLPKYAILDFSVRVPIAPKVGLYFAVENAFDEAYVVRTAPLDILGTPRMVHGGVELQLFQ